MPHFNSHFQYANGHHEPVRSSQSGGSEPRTRRSVLAVSEQCLPRR
ncbi:hypothetical protein VTH06DRAFT_3294 [Thermothelomyces fergusii]